MKCPECTKEMEHHLNKGGKQLYICRACGKRDSKPVKAPAGTDNPKKKGVGSNG